MNISLPRVTTAQEKVGSEVSLNSLQPGDLLFYGMRGNTTHVGIYIGNNKMIHAPKPGQNVTTVDIKYYYPNFARRILSAAPTPTPNTMSSYERDSLVKAGWNYEQVSFYSGGTVPVYCLFNPNAKGTQESHAYTVSSYEKDSLVSAGWRYEKIAFYALRTR